MQTANRAQRRAEQARARRSRRVVAPTIVGVANTTHHLRLSGPADALARAQVRFAHEGSFRVRDWRDSAAPRSADLWLSYEGQGPQAEAVVEWAATEPALGIDLTWYDGGLNDGERIAIRNGAVVSRGSDGYQPLYTSVYGRPDAGYTPGTLFVPGAAVGRPVLIADAARDGEVVGANIFVHG
jgi:hypothetical protein